MMNKLYNILFLSLLVLAYCSRDNSIDPETSFVSEYEFITLHQMCQNCPLPVIVLPKENDLFFGNNTKQSYSLAFNQQTSSKDFFLKKGTGCAIIETGLQNTFTFEIENITERKTINTITLPEKHVSGNLNGFTEWKSDTCYIVDSDLTIQTSDELKIQEGTIVLLKNTVNLFVYGKLLIEGSKDKPVYFTAYEANGAWGGIEYINTTANLSFCIFNNGGADQEKEFGHSHSQPVLMFNESDSALDHCFLFDNPGKALGTKSCTVTIDNCLISRCDTGGEFLGSLMTITNTRVMDMPNDDGIFVDDDNDGFYFSSHADTDEPSRVEHCLIMTGKDDAIDHNKAKLVINDCLLMDCMHEGLAASNANYARISNCVVSGCEQGIEAGYYEPNVFVDHCVVINNKFGLRFGDSYDWGCNGSMQVTNTILYNNEDNIYNFDIKKQGTVENAINISYSITNDPDYNNSPNCISGTPLFNNQYQLLSGSPGLGSGTNNSNIGLN